MLLEPHTIQGQGDPYQEWKRRQFLVAQKANWEEHWRTGNTEELRKDRFSNRKKPTSREAKGLRCACLCCHPESQDSVENATFFPVWHWLSGSSKLPLNLYLLKTQAEYHNNPMAHGALRLREWAAKKYPGVGVGGGKTHM